MSLIQSNFPEVLMYTECTLRVTETFFGKLNSMKIEVHIS